MPKVRYGTPGLNMPPIEGNLAACKMWEDAGLDFLCWFDQLSFTIPRSIWTPDLVPGAALWDIDAWLEPWPMVTQAALNTSRIELGVVFDGLRRVPPVIAQLGLTMSHFAPDRFFITLGAGEEKQFKPYGVPRNRPFAHLEETLKITRKCWENNDLFDYDGPIWKMDRAIFGLQPPEPGKYPKVLVAGGPGKALRFSAQLADGWMSYTPGVGTPEMYAEQVQQQRRYAEETGKDPDKSRILLACLCVIGEDDDEVTRATENPAIRWDAAAMLPDVSPWTRAPHLPKNPMGDDWSYARDMMPMWWSREDALKIVDQTPPEAVRATRFCGTPSEVADQLLPYVEAGATDILMVNYVPLIMSGDFSDALQGSSKVAETVDIMRKTTG